MDPEDAMPVGDLLKHCGRSMVYISYDTPVAQLFRDFKRGRSHLAFVLRGRAEVPQNSPSKIGSALGTVAECEGEAGGGEGRVYAGPGLQPLGHPHSELKDVLTKVADHHHYQLCTG